MKPTRYPERCPYCGSPENIRADGARTGTYCCGWYMGRSKAWCQEFTAPAEYREELAWRKRLSQHTGVPVRLVPEPIRLDGYPTWRDGIWFELLGGRWRLQCWHQADIGQMRLPIRERARRRLLAKGE